MLTLVASAKSKTLGPMRRGSGAVQRRRAVFLKALEEETHPATAGQGSGNRAAATGDARGGLSVREYAFDDDRIGHVRVDFVRANDGLVLSVSDDGKGRSQECEAGLGTRLVTVFAAQLSGDARWEVSPEGGCKATIIFPE